MRAMKLCHAPRFFSVRRPSKPLPVVDEDGEGAGCLFGGGGSPLASAPPVCHHHHAPLRMRSTWQWDSRDAGPQQRRPPRKSLVPNRQRGDLPTPVPAVPCPLPAAGGSGAGCAVDAVEVADGRAYLGNHRWLIDDRALAPRRSAPAISIARVRRWRCDQCP